MMDFDIPPPSPAQFIINEEAMGKYHALYRLNLRLRLALISLNEVGLPKCDDPATVIRLQQHLLAIIRTLFSFIQSGVIAPLLSEFNEKMKKADTFDQIYAGHLEMLDMISARVLFTTMSKNQLNIKINYLISLAIDFERARHNPRAYSDFVTYCTEIKIIMDAISKRGGAMADWFQYLAHVFYYTPKRNQSRGVLVSERMSHGPCDMGILCSNTSVYLLFIP